MAGLTKPGRVVNNFIPAWLEQSVQGVRNAIWLEENPQVGNEARCKLCKTSAGEKKIIKMYEGYTAIKKHAIGAKHKENDIKVQRVIQTPIYLILQPSTLV